VGTAEQRLQRRSPNKTAVLRDPPRDIASARRYEHVFFHRASDELRRDN